MSTSADITHKAKSNLAFALHILPRQQRQDMTVYYAYCRTLDDIADDESVPAKQRADALCQWQQGLTEGFDKPSPLQQELTELRDRLEIPNELLIATIDGCLMDLEKTRYETWDELSDYIWKVASSVGLVSAQIFGCTSPESKKYAVSLGKALQLTNILRDVGEDLAERNRIYIPQKDLHQFGYSEQDLIQHVRDDRFQALMAFETHRAQNLFEEASFSLIPMDRHALRPARIMSDIYQELLARMVRGGFRVFDRRYKVDKLSKALIFCRHLMG